MERRKIRHVNLLRIIHARMELETDHHHQPLLQLCMPPSVGGFWQETFLHVNSNQVLLALQSLNWEGRCQIAQSQIKSIESEKIVAALLSLSPFMNSMHLNQGDLINATIQGVWKQ